MSNPEPVTDADAELEKITAALKAKGYDVARVERGTDGKVFVVLSDAALYPNFDSQGFVDGIRIESALRPERSPLPSLEEVIGSVKWIEPKSINRSGANKRAPFYAGLKRKRR